MLKDKIKAVVSHPAAGFVTIVAVNVAAVAVSYAVSRKIEKASITEA